MMVVLPLCADMKCVAFPGYTAKRRSQNLKFSGSVICTNIHLSSYVYTNTCIDSYIYTNIIKSSVVYTN
jgi:hypothetical protein